MNVLDIMTPKVVCVYKSDSLEKVLQVMEKTGSHHLIVVEADGSLVGIISDRDCKEALLSPITTFNARQQSKFASQITVERIMTPAPITIMPQVTIQEAANLMLEKHIHALPVLHDGCVIGIVTSTDLLKVLASLAEIVTV
ncbi:MAG: CBS domain-containing protein [Anaerolineae bacterium]|nr:CBS domain-containing protein [Anaerolineae bacterium]